MGVLCNTGNVSIDRNAEGVQDRGLSLRLLSATVNAAILDNAGEASKLTAMMKGPKDGATDPLEEVPKTGSRSRKRVSEKALESRKRDDAKSCSVKVEDKMSESDSDEII